MSKRSQWCEFNDKERSYIKIRDEYRCVICHANYGLQIMHIFVNRSHGGKGTRENGCLGCYRCHGIIDNPIGKKQNEQSKQMLDYCKRYLIKKEKLIINDEFIKGLIYKKN